MIESLTAAITLKPKIFISYSWTDQEHEERILAWCERLTSDGVEVVIDKWSLSEGHDKFAFMEQMVTDPSITHVLVVTDAAYARKADSRTKGVGTESQIISAEVYGKTTQDKFLPLVCEYDEVGEPCLPVFLKGRIYFKFSSPEDVNASWEKLIRKLFNKPLYVKPSLGKVPAYITQPSAPANATAAKFLTLKDAILKGKPTVEILWEDYVSAVVDQLELYRIPTEPKISHEEYAEKIDASLEAMLPVRNELIEAIGLLNPTFPEEETGERIGDLLERLLPFKYRPESITSFNGYWWDNYGFFLYELFLHVVGALLQRKQFGVLSAVLDRRYLQPDHAARNGDRSKEFTEFAFYSELWKQLTGQKRLGRISVEADHIQKRATNTKLPMRALIEADVVCCLRARKCLGMWPPYTVVYATYSGTLDLFLRAQQRKWFTRLAQVLNVKDKTTLEQELKKYLVDRQNFGWLTIHSDASIERLIGWEKLDTLP